jgi:hypothetical protein
MPNNKLWGSERFESNTQPNWYTGVGDQIYTRPNHPAADENLEATDRGWEQVIRYTDAHGVARTKREVVVANRELVNALAYGTSTEVTAATTGSPQITDIRWHQASYVATDTEVGVVVTFSEPVLVTASNWASPPTIATGQIGGSGPSKVALSLNHAASGNGTNKLLFVSTWDLDAADTLALVDNKAFITIGTGTITGAKTQYGRGANTVTADATRVANLSSYGVASLGSSAVVVTGDARNLAAGVATETVV